MLARQRERNTGACYSALYTVLVRVGNRTYYGTVVKPPKEPIDHLVTIGTDPSTDGNHTTEHRSLRATGARKRRPGTLLKHAMHRDRAHVREGSRKY